MRALAIGIALAAGACAHRGELPYHRLDPAPTTHSSERGVSVHRVSSISLPGGRDRPTTLWVELELTNTGAAPWSVDCTSLALERGSCAGFAEMPGIRAMLAPTATIAAGTAKRVWARFDRVPTQDVADADAGIDRPLPITLHVGEDKLALSDPSTGAPHWNAQSWPYFATFGFGFGFGFGETNGAGMDISTAFHRRSGEFDLGIVGQLRAGIDVHGMSAAAMQATGLASFGGGLTVGYTTYLGRRAFLRSAVHAVVTRTAHGMIETTPVWLGGELQLGFSRKSLYPFRERTTSYTVGWYLRAEGRVTSLSPIEEPFGLSLSAGVVVRGGS